jgi:hypothetical protein
MRLFVDHRREHSDRLGCQKRQNHQGEQNTHRDAPFTEAPTAHLYRYNIA